MQLQVKTKIKIKNILKILDFLVELIKNYDY